MLSKKIFHMVMEQAPVPKSQKHPHFSFTSSRAATVFALVHALLGAACILFTEQIHDIFPFLLGFLMLGIGICDIYRGVVTKEYQTIETKLISWGIVNTILGVVILCHHQNSDQIIGAIWGMVGVVKGSEKLNHTIHLYASHQPFFKELFHSILELALGILLLLDPIASFEHHLVILGIELIIRSIQTVSETRRSAEDLK